MKKVTAFVGSPRKRHTYESVRQFLAFLQSLGGVESEIVVLSDCNVTRCKGCCVCFDKGEEFCPFHADDRDALIDRMMASDGVVFASPTYSFQVSAVMKTFLDRLGFMFHRPRFFGKTFTSIVVQGIYGGPKVVEYLDFVGRALGFNVVKGSCLLTLEPLTPDARDTIDSTLSAHAKRFHDSLSRASLPGPRLLELMLFRMARTKIQLTLDEKNRDYRYYRDQGWFQSDFFYPVHLDPARKALGWAFDRGAARAARKDLKA